MPTDLIAALRGEDGDLFAKEAADMLERQQKLLDKDAAVAGHMQSIVDGLRAQLEALRSAAGLAIERAAVFDDGTDGADAESARSVVAILRGALVPQPADATDTAGPFRGDDAALVRNARALLNLDARGALTPGGIGEHARTIIAAFIERWPATGAVAAGYALVPVETIDQAATWLEVHAPGGGCIEGSVAQDLRALLAASPAPEVPTAPCENHSTTSDRYRAELYDEVWQKARDMGYGNVTEALSALAGAKAQPAPQHHSGDAAALVEALELYAQGNHLLLADPDAWDTCSGEPMNFLHDESGTASVEDGSIAKATLAAYRAQPAAQQGDEVRRLREALDIATGRWAALAADPRFSEAEHRREQPALNKALQVLDTALSAQQGEGERT